MPDELNANEDLKSKIESIRLQAGLAMGLNNVLEKAVPKMSLVSKPRYGGAINTQTFIPKHCHKAIGVLGAVSVATAALFKHSVTYTVAKVPDGQTKDMSIEHPSGSFAVRLLLSNRAGQPHVKRVGLLRTTRMLCRGEVYVPQSVWDGKTS